MREDPPPPDVDPLLNQVVAEKYCLQARVGHGSMGSVYRAQHLVLQSPVAIKLLSPKRIKDATQVERFRREAQALARVRDERCVSVVDFGSALGTLFIAMEYVDGVTLAEELRITGPFEVDRALHVAGELLRGLDAIHAVGLVHRDVKPQNIMLSHKAAERDLVKIVDFGIVKLLESEGERTLTAPGVLFGTPEYMSPEQVLGEPLTPRADIYSAGVVAYHLLLGQNPFRGVDARDTLQRVTQSPPPRLAQARPDLLVPEGLEALLGRLVAKKPEDRFATAAEAALALAALPPAPRVRRAPASSPPMPGIAPTPVAPLPRPQATPATALRPAGPNVPTEPDVPAVRLPARVWPVAALFLVLAAGSAYVTSLVLTAEAPQAAPDAAVVPAVVPAVPDAAVAAVDAGLPDAAVAPRAPATKAQRAAARAALKRGQKMMDVGKLADAITALEQAVESDDTTAEAHLKLGALYYRQYRFADSREHYRRYLELRPEAPNAAHIGMVLEALSTAP